MEKLYVKQTGVQCGIDKRLILSGGIDMEFTDKELEQIKYALEHLHDADISDLGNENIAALESAMTKLEIKFVSQL